MSPPPPASPVIGGQVGLRETQQLIGRGDDADVAEVHTVVVVPAPALAQVT